MCPQEQQHTGMVLMVLKVESKGGSVVPEQENIDHKERVITHTHKMCVSCCTRSVERRTAQRENTFCYFRYFS